MDAMFAIAISGKNAMPPKGACMDCSDDDLKAAIEYMVSQSK
jgi:cytochrome c5